MKSVFIAGLLCSLILVLGGCGGGENGGSTTQTELNPPPVASAADDLLVDTAAATYGVNLIRNGGFELDTGGDGNTVITPLRWTTTVGKMTVVKYGAAGGFPTAASPGPLKRGLNFLAGGLNVSGQGIGQAARVGWAASEIDAGKARCVGEAFLGGYGSQDDYVALTIHMFAADGKEISSKPFKSVKALDRNNQTGLLKRVCKLVVPRLTRRIEVWAVFLRSTAPYNDGYMDNVSMRLEKIKP